MSERIGTWKVDPEGQAKYWKATGQQFFADIWYALRDGHIGLDTANELAGYKLWYIEGE